jgi:hypothetical protein
MDESDSWHGAFRIELRAEAISLAWRGWPVLPGTIPTSSPQQAGDDRTTQHQAPVHSDWAERIGTPPAQVASWWTGVPYSLLVATGVVLDAVEVDARIGRRVAALLRASGTVTPIAATPGGQWLFFTSVAERPHAELLEQPNVTLHGRGSWIPLPPSPHGEGIVHWRVKPHVCGWQLPNAALVQDAVATAVTGSGALELIGVGSVGAQSPPAERLSA